ncbi:iron-sulfur cluster co-chaperone protein HscB [Venturia canescens]|uniref:iron-sulfur cluster co-chaperone protein HscB n=1 Tax=Venturia canescens TaxID=32260 RepID=UPI001C9D21E8|nr:iron-sulfur cluster co-chaperone protein HscB [Venturia canescens]
MCLRFIGSNLFFALKNWPKISRDQGIRSRFYNNQYLINNKVLRSKLPGKLLYSSDSPVKCWQCNYPFKSEFFCQKCKALQEPPEKLNYFQIIGIQESYDLDSKDLHKKYRDLQNILHPDRFNNKTEKEKHISENISSLINKAYNTLSHPLSRGLYILRLKNMTIPEGTTNLNPEFLMEIMELNEKVEEASRDKEKIVQLMDQNNAVLDKLSQEVSAAFKLGDFERGKMILVEMKYYTSVQSRLKKLKQELGIVDD